MSRLFWIRHAQASFFETDYDRLSSIGEQQARLLGEFWIERGVTLDAVFVGPRVRQVRTAELAGECYRGRGMPWPEPVRLAELDEHGVDQILNGSIREIASRHAHVRELAVAYETSSDRATRQTTFQRLFEAVAHLWIEGACNAAGIESWAAFRDRVRTAVARVTNGERRGRTVAAFTSVGPTSVVLQHALACSDRTALDLGWRVRNCSVSEFVFTRDRFTLDSFNSLAHLADSALWTYR